MKKIFYTLAACLFALGFSACSDDNDALTDTTLTHYVSFELNGDDFVIVPVGTEYVDEGCRAEMNGEDYTSKVTVDGLDDIDVNSIGLYEVTYSAVSPDGYPSSISRTVAVCDPNVKTDISGIYTSQPGSGFGSVSLAGFDFTIKKAAPGIFYISDMMCGLYAQYVGYGAKYALVGYISLDIDNNIEAISAEVPGWHDSYEYFETGTYDPEAKTITYDVYYYKYLIHTILKFKKSLES